jgi:hypothetical protein
MRERSGVTCSAAKGVTYAAVNLEACERSVRVYSLDQAQNESKGLALFQKAAFTSMPSKRSSFIQVKKIDGFAGGFKSALNSLKLEFVDP